MLKGLNELVQVILGWKGGVSVWQASEKVVLPSWEVAERMKK